MTSARRASLKKMSRPSLLFRFKVIDRLLRCKFWKSGPSRRLPVASACSARRLDLDDLGAPIGELAHRGRAGAMGGRVDDKEIIQRQREKSASLFSRFVGVGREGREECPASPSLSRALTKHLV